MPLSYLLIGLLAFSAALPAKGHHGGITDTSLSPHAKIRSVDLNAVQWTQGFWAERLHTSNHLIVDRDIYDTILVLMDSRSRSIVKAISYRILASLTTAFIFFVLTGNAAVSLGAGALDSVLRLGLYFFHERLWNQINFGRHKAPEYEI